MVTAQPTVLLPSQRSRDLISLTVRRGFRFRRRSMNGFPSLAEARAKLEARAKERFEREMAEHRAKLAARDEKTAASGKKPGGRPLHHRSRGRNPRIRST